MGTEKLVYGAVALLAFGIVLSIGFFAMPVTVSAGTVNYTPSDTIIDVLQGQVFLVRNTLQFNQPQPAYFALAIFWYTNDSSDNYALENTPSAYWTSGGSGVGNPVENVVFDNVAITDGWQISALIDSADKNYYNGTFNVDFWLRAASPDGTFHKVSLENNLSYGVGIAIIEPTPNIVPEDNIAVNVLPVIAVSIFPSENSAMPEENTTFIVTVKNKGNFSDTYSLAVSDNASPSWAPTVSPTSLVVPAGENRTATLSVTIPSGAPNGTQDNITVTATRAGVSENASCIAESLSIIRGVTVSISPSSQGGANGATLFYDVSVTNTGNVNDDYSLTVTDNASPTWDPTLNENPVEGVAPGETRVITLSVSVPVDAVGGTIDSISITANGTGVSAEDSCTAEVTVSKGVSVSISPTSQSGADNATLTYTVKVKNTGNVPDNYSLTVIDNEDWSPNVSSTTLLNVSPGENRTATLSVIIPENALGGTKDNITVTANGTGASDSQTCTAQVTIVRGVNVQVTPSVQENVPHGDVTFTVEILNTGNVLDNFNLTWSDNENWSPTLDENLFENVTPRDNMTTILRVTIPDTAKPGTEDNITITATSLADNTIKGENNCIVHVAIPGVLVTISPGEKSAFSGENVTFTVTVRNTGENADNYILYVIDNLSWGLSLADNLFENLAPGLNRTTTLMVSIPENAVPGTSDKITVTATSLENENRIDIATCIASSIAITRAVGVSISPGNTGGMPGNGLSFTVRVKNNGNIADNYDLTFNDNANWNPTISENTLEIPAGENQAVTLTVTVPDNAAPGIIEGITVTATCRENVAVSDSATCLIQALILRAVEVSISPEYINGPPGAVLDYTVRVTNTGRSLENFMIVASGTEGWITSIFPDFLILEPGQSGEATLSITVPLSASGSSMIFYIWAVSSADPMVRNYDTCRAIALELKKEAGLAIPWIQIILIAAIIAVVVFAVGYLTRRRGRRRKRRGLLNALKLHFL